MLSATIFLATVATLLDAVSAHGFVSGVITNGTWTKGSDPAWYYSSVVSRSQTAGWDSLNQDYGFIEPASFNTDNIACHKNATAAKLYANVVAGSQLTFYWNTWPESHKGPIINYIAPCNGECSTLSPGSLKWSKISQAGLITHIPANPGIWATDNLIKANFTSTTTIPKNLKAGNYVIRHEIIALHNAGVDNGAQLYPQCLNLKVTGSGRISPSGGVAGNALYKRTDVGIRINLFNSPTSYTFPGPALWTTAD